MLHAVAVDLRLESAGATVRELAGAERSICCTLDLRLDLRLGLRLDLRLDLRLGLRGLLTVDATIAVIFRLERALATVGVLTVANHCQLSSFLRS